MSFHGDHPGDPPPKPRPSGYDRDDEHRYDPDDPPVKAQRSTFNHKYHDHGRAPPHSSYGTSPYGEVDYNMDFERGSDNSPEPPRSQGSKVTSDRNSRRNEDRRNASRNTHVDNHIPAQLEPPSFFDAPLDDEPEPDPYGIDRDIHYDRYQSSPQSSTPDVADTFDGQEEKTFLNKSMAPSMPEHTPAKKVTKAKRAKPWAIFAVAVFFLGGAGALGWYLSTVFASKGALSPAVATDQGSDASSSIQAPPKDFVEQCNRKFITASNHALVLCEGLCNAAECCYNNTCFSQNKDICTSYSPMCDFLFGALPRKNIILTEPPRNLTSLCSPSAWNNGGQQACMDACYDGYCCFSSTSSILLSDEAKPSCFEVNVETCIRYSPCAGILISQVESQMGDSDQETDDATEYTSSEDLTNAPRVSKPTSNLKQMCSGDSLDTQLGFVHCMSACTKATCCTVENGPTSCAKNYSETCDLYAPCEAFFERLEQGDTGSNTTSEAQLDPPHESIEAACYSTSIFQKAVCKFICEEAACCFSATESCAGKNPDVCAKYAPCQCLDDDLCQGVDDDFSAGDGADGNGTEANATIDMGSTSAPDNITDVCYSDEVSRKVECGNVCELAVCCFSETGNCVEDYEQLCETYTPCLCLLDEERCQNVGDESNFTLSPPPKGLEANCSAESISKADDCTIACQIALCCFEVGGSCNQSQPTVCSQYAPCLILLEDNDNKTENSTLLSIELACSVDFIEREKGGLECEELCLQGSCCFIEFGEDDSCVDNIAFCANFRQCSLLEGNIPWPVLNSSAIEESCQLNSTLTEKGLANCTDLCKTGRCCFFDSKDPASCTSDEDFCAYYEVCGSFLADLDDSGEFPKESDNSTDVDQACRVEFLGDDSGLENCTALCWGSECCFAVGGKNATCADDFDFCAEFEVCAVIFNPKNPSAIATACNKKAGINNTDSRDLCMDLCAIGACCWEEPQSDRSCAERTEFCADYEPCFALVEDNMTLTESGQDGDDTPGVDDDDKTDDNEDGSDTDWVGCTEKDISKRNLTRCEEYCDEYICCYDGTICEDDVKNCDFLTQVCEYIRSGNVTIDGSNTIKGNSTLHSNSTVQTNTTVAHVCSSDFIESADLGNASCIEECAAGACCFLVSTDGGSCAHDVDFCVAYEKCSIVLVESDVAQACSTDSISLVGKQPCEELCENGFCCHVEPSNETSCRDDLGLCSYYESCKALVGKTKVEIVCNAETIATDGDETCVELCEPGRCCFVNPTNATSCSAQVGTCAYYELCKGVISANEIEKACSVESIATRTGNLACEDLCADGECCFLAASDGDSCLDKPGFCSYFEPCSILATSANNSTAATLKGNKTDTGVDLDESVEVLTEPLPELQPLEVTDQVDAPKSTLRCTSDDVAKGNIDDCYEVCEELSCCFEDDSCGVTNEAKCKEYTPICKETLGIF